MLQVKEVSIEELSASSQMVLLPALNQVIDMTKKEEEILFPMALDQLKEEEWLEVQKWGHSTAFRELFSRRITRHFKPSSYRYDLCR